MAKLSRLEHAHQDIQAWANWIISHIDNSAIGYGRRTIEGRAITEAIGVQLSNYFTSTCPEVMMPHYVARIDRIIPQLPLLLHQVALCKYLPELAERKYLCPQRVKRVTFKRRLLELLSNQQPTYQPHKGQWKEAHKVQLYRDITGRGQADYYKQHGKLLRLVSEEVRK